MLGGTTVGFFSKIKDNLQHGGVKVTLEAPTNVSMQDPSLSATITLTNTATEPRTITSMALQILATTKQTGTVQMGSISLAPSDDATTTSSSTQPMPTTEVVAEVTSQESFTLNEGETKTIPVTLALNAAGNVAQSAGNAGVATQVISALARYTASGSWTSYKLSASVNVEGIALDPNDSKELQIVQNGQAVGGFQINS